MNHFSTDQASVMRHGTDGRAKPWDVFCRLRGLPYYPFGATSCIQSASAIRDYAGHLVGSKAQMRPGASLPTLTWWFHHVSPFQARPPYPKNGLAYPRRHLHQNHPEFSSFVASLCLASQKRNPAQNSRSTAKTSLWCGQVG